MEFEYIEKKEQGRFITRYDVHYKMADGQEKVYEMISSDRNITSFEQLHNDRENGHGKMGIQLPGRTHR